MWMWLDEEITVAGEADVKEGREGDEGADLQSLFVTCRSSFCVSERSQDGLSAEEVGDGSLVEESTEAAAHGVPPARVSP